MQGKEILGRPQQHEPDRRRPLLARALEPQTAAMLSARALCTATATLRGRARLPNRTSVRTSDKCMRTGLSSKVYRQSWADKGYDPLTHHYRITRISLVRESLHHTEENRFAR